MDKIIRHAYINAIEKGFPEEGPYLRMYTRGYEIPYRSENWIPDAQGGD